jgi:hypothetical protein
VEHDLFRKPASTFRDHALTSGGTRLRAAIDEGKRPMKMIAYVLGLICAIAAVMYFTMQAGSLPTFMPGYVAGSTHIHTSHALAAAVAAVVLFGIGWFSGRR